MGGRLGESASPQTRSQPHASVAGLCSAGLVLMAACRSFGKQSSSTTTRRAFENETGVQPPLGFFDPLGFTNDGDVSDFYRRREVELKNGRVAMFATIGYIAPEWFRFPGTLTLDAETKFSAMPNGLKLWTRSQLMAGFRSSAGVGSWSFALIHLRTPRSRVTMAEENLGFPPASPSRTQNRENLD